jgi:hypothetical protein
MLPSPERHSPPKTNPNRQPCEVHYNPTLTPLRGRPEVYVSGGFNRWRHPQRHGPALMQPTMRGALGFAKTVVQVGPGARPASRGAEGRAVRPRQSPPRRSWDPHRRAA